MVIGIPREILSHENRVAALPDAVSKYIGLGFKALVESGAGDGALHYDDEYRQAGAEIVSGPDELYSRADIVLKVKQPCVNEETGRDEAEMLREGSTLVTFLHPANPAHHAMIRTLRDRNITSFTMDGVPRTSRAQRMDALTSMSTITGYKAVIMAACHFPKFIPMIGTAIGVVKPAKCLIVGCGVVGLQAVATAKRLGASVKAVDIRKDARENAASVGAKIAGFDAPEEIALGEGGYAKALPADWLEKERDAIRPHVEEADIVILSALVPGEVAPTLITEQMIINMAPGSVIVDVSIDQGGNCALTEPGKEILRHKALISGVQNIPGSVPVHASWLYSNNLLEYVKNLYKNGIGKPDLEDDIVRETLVTMNGIIHHRGALKAMGIS